MMSKDSRKLRSIFGLFRDFFADECQIFALVRTQETPDTTQDRTVTGGHCLDSGCSGDLVSRPGFQEPYIAE